MDSAGGAGVQSKADSRDALREAIVALHRCDEDELVTRLIGELAPIHSHARAMERASRLVAAQRAAMASAFGFEHFLQEYRLGSEEGLHLLCLAEAYLRIPDAPTASALIHDKLGSGDWAAHRGRSGSALVNASTVALSLAQRLIEAERSEGVVARLLARGGEAALRGAVAMAMRLIGDQFVFATTIEAALQRAAGQRGWCHSFDMLGEAARTASDASRYFEAYRHAIQTCAVVSAALPARQRPSVSIKLSALHPRYEEAQRSRVLAELGDRLVQLSVEARQGGIGIAVDAEESERLELSLDLVERTLATAELRGWPGFGVAVQAYQKRAGPTVDWLAGVAAARGVPLTVRLVKGAYWDSEIRRAQVGGLSDYPVFTRKAATDLSYLACARRLFEATMLFPALATHNALSVASLLELASALKRGPDQFEFQRLHGMGDGLYNQLVADQGWVCRIYAPVGQHRDLLAYLVRRLLENGANSSFVHRLADARLDEQALLADPLSELQRSSGRRHQAIARPLELYLPERRNSVGLDLHDRRELERLAAHVHGCSMPAWVAAPMIAGVAPGVAARSILNPANRGQVVGEVGEVVEACEADVERAVESARMAFAEWSNWPVEARAAVLERMSDRIEASRDDYIALLVREAGRTLADAAAEVREAIDFCRYYAIQARTLCAPRALPGPTGEQNTLRLSGRGVFACISPWNFPLAIFTGQIAAALAAGNAALAKPAQQTPLVAYRAVTDWQAAGLPPGVLSLLPGGPNVGAGLVRGAQLGGVAFTGSVATARAIARALALRDGPLVPLIAETGGINSMIVDASALPEQVVADAMISAFNSAGQRCSALRLLWLQDDIADRVIDMLCGAMDELRVGDPADPATDVGPIIDDPALARLQAQLASGSGRIIHRASLSEACEQGTFFAPTLVGLDDPTQLRDEVFGPIMHFVRWRAGELDAVLDCINGCGYGLTLGLHSRIDALVERVRERARVGNLYVNRPTIGAVVGAQPFGGEGLSGTGPKAGGPWTLLRYGTERCVSIDTTSAGGNASLMAAADRPDSADLIR